MFFWCVFDTVAIENDTRNEKLHFWKNTISKRPYGTFWGFLRIAAMLRIQGAQQKYEKFMLKSMLKYAYDLDTNFDRFLSNFELIFHHFWDILGSKHRVEKKEKNNNRLPRRAARWPVGTFLVGRQKISRGRSSTPSPRGGGGRIEPAEPVAPPAPFFSFGGLGRQGH